MTDRVLRGRQFLHTPGPTIMPDRVLRAMDRQALDHRGAEFLATTDYCFAALRRMFKTRHPVLIQPTAGSGTWAAALDNLCAEGDGILIPETGFFSSYWREMAIAHGLDVTYLAADWRDPIDPNRIEEILRADTERRIKVVAMVHNETSTGILHPLQEVAQAIKAAGHPAFLVADAISSLVCMDLAMDDWGVDVTLCGAQKGLMLPPGLGFIAINDRAYRASLKNPTPRFYMDWRKLLGEDGNTPGFLTTPPINLILGLHEALKMIEEEGLEAVFARHARLAGAVRACVNGWHGNGEGPALFGNVAESLSNSVTAVTMPEGHDAPSFRRFCVENYNLVLASGLGQMADTAFRIGHLGDLNEPMILGTLATIETGMRAAGIPHAPGLGDAIAHLSQPA